VEGRGGTSDSNHGETHALQIWTNVNKLSDRVFASAIFYGRKLHGMDDMASNFGLAQHSVKHGQAKLFFAYGSCLTENSSPVRRQTLQPQGQT
jgi:hypothetical protein